MIRRGTAAATQDGGTVAEKILGTGSKLLRPDVEHSPSIFHPG